MNRSEDGDGTVGGPTVPPDQTNTPANAGESVPAEEPEAVDYEAEIERLREESEQNYDKFQRAVADLANYRRRKSQEVFRVEDQTRRAVLKQILPVMDDLERAVRTASADASNGSWLEGFRLIERKLWAVLESEGVRPMTALGEAFDPHLHEAVQVEEGTGSPDTVVEEYARGYFVGDSVLRPAMVKVGTKPEETVD